MLKAAAVCLLVLGALINDIIECKVSNVLVIVFSLAGFAINTSIYGLKGAEDAAAGFILPVTLLFPLFALEMLGAGDIKLFGAIGTLIGLRSVLHIMLYSFIAGGFIAALLLFIRKNAAERSAYFAAYVKNCFLTGKLQEYGSFKQKENSSLFRFSFATAAGTAIQLALQLLNYM